MLISDWSSDVCSSDLPGGADNIWGKSSHAGFRQKAKQIMSAPLHVACPHCATVNRLPAERLADGGKCGRCSQPLFAGRPLTVTAQNFDRHAGADLPRADEHTSELQSLMRIQYAVLCL